MTGYLIRTKKPETKDIVDLTDEEFADFLEGRDAAELGRWVDGLRRWIKKNVVAAPESEEVP